MYVMFNGKVCLMMWNISAEKWTYIPEFKWYSMSYEQRKNFREER